MQDEGIYDESLDVVIQHPSLAIDAERCRRVLTLVFEGEEIEVASVTLVLADHATVHELNRSYLQHDYETDVLAFRYSDDGEPLEGEIYVDLDTAAERHREFGATFEQEALRYAVHGALHLAGYSDTDSDGKKEMHELEDRYLGQTGGDGPEQT